MAEIKNLDDTLVMDRAGEAPKFNPEDAAPERVAHYDLKREIGRGALSVVYEAEDTHTGQEVALKLLTLSSSLTLLEAEALIVRFEREARTAARLSHPNIVHIHEVGAEHGRHFLAMEYLKGQTLRKRMGEGMLTPTEAFSILTQLAGALDAVHKAGIVHRDVKPTNAILLPDGTVKLLDFGIARSSKETAILDRGIIVGSPSYMAPEQIKGDAATKAIDIWALGVLSCEMLTGRLPFTGQNIGGVMFQIMHEAPALAADLPQPVQKVMLRALDKRPSQRYSTAGALVQALKLAYPKQAPAILEQKPAAAFSSAALPKSVKLPKPVLLKPAASFSLPGPKWAPEAALLGLFLLGFSGAYLARLHTNNHTQQAAAPAAARSLGRNSLPVPVQASAPVPVQASAPTPVLPVPQPQAASSDIPSLPDPAPAAVQYVPALSVIHKAPVAQAKRVGAPVRPLPAAQTIAAVPVQPHRSPVSANPANTKFAAKTNAKFAAPQQVSTASGPHSAASPVSHPAPIQVASRHLPVPPVSPQPVPRTDRSEPEQTTAQFVPARAAVPPVPAQSAEQAVTLPAPGDSYDPEADARRRKSAWSQDGTAAHP